MDIEDRFKELEKLVKDAQEKDKLHRQLLMAFPASQELMKKGRPSHPLAGKVAKAISGDEIEVKDWFEKLFGIPYLLHNLDRPPLIIYFCRMAFDHSVPIDNDVVLVKCRGMGALLHNSEISGK